MTVVNPRSISAEPVETPARPAPQRSSSWAQAAEAADERFGNPATGATPVISKVPAAPLPPAGPPTWAVPEEPAVPEEADAPDVDARGSTWRRCGCQRCRGRYACRW